MENIHIFFNEFRLNAGAVWLEGDALNLSVPKKFQNQETKDFIVNNKNHIISVLKENQIFSIEKFLSVEILRDNTITHYPLSPSQERLWFIEQYEEGTNAFHIPTFYELDVNTDVEGLKYALQQIVKRHEVLRSTIELGDDQKPYQVIHDKPLIIKEIALALKEDYELLIKEDINRPFDLNSEYPIRTIFYTVQSGKDASENPLKRTILLINIHHIATDGWSMDIFLRELFAYYNAYTRKDTDFCLPALEIQYKDYAVWQRAFLVGDTLEKQLNYWKTKLSGYQDLELPTDYVRPNKINNEGSSEEFSIDKAISQKLRALSQHYGVTLQSVMLSSFSILLSKYTGQDDIVIGSPIANRHRRQTEGLIGFFINTQVNRILLNNNQKFEDLIRQVHKDQVEAQLNQDLPIDDLIAELGVERDASRNNIFQVYFVVQSFGKQHSASEQQKKYITPIQENFFYKVEKFDLSVNIDDDGEEITGDISYATSLFHSDTIVRIIHQYIHLLTQLTKAPEKSYSQLCLLDADEYNQIIYKWNETDKDYPKDKSIHQLFQEQVIKTPDNIAVVYGQQKLTYHELDEKSNQLAWFIRTQYQQRTKQTLKADTLIALYLDRSLEMIVGILGVLKAGGAYVPMDPTYPQERLDYMLEDTNTELILSQKHLSGHGNTQLPHGKVVYIDLTEELYNKEDKSNLPQYNKSTDLAYVIYTSGTTGNPKGVMVEHAGVNNEILSQLEMIPLVPSDKSLLTANIIFDAAAECIYMSLFSGGSLHILDNKSILDSDYIKEYVESSGINVFNTTPSYLNSLGINLFSPNVKHIILGGEAYQKVESSAKVYNTYGPTETTIVSTGGEVDYNKKIHIGKPINNTRVYVLDQNNTPVPIGVIGELYIGGAGLTRGYLKLPKLTEERFVLNPFITEADKAKGYTKMYKTGDLVRWLPDGNLEFMGRNDDQVKIRGHRIELSEVEHALNQIQGVKQSCVLVKERKTETDSSNYLVGYYVLENIDNTISQVTILSKLSLVLPEYMMPSALVAMESFPLTINGKLDKRNFPEPDFHPLTREYVEPRSENEKAICEIWQELLGLEKIGITDDFFQIGGNSILAIQVSHRMRKVLGGDVKVADVFKLKTINSLIENITLMQKNHENVEFEF
ncbi:MAG: amino acid adenylation domain-containing protein [Bacteroidales bacterium]|nr:amino acid adenylation domain-containing protein [Bacteroidales bacterium]